MHARDGRQGMSIGPFADGPPALHNESCVDGHQSTRAPFLDQASVECPPALLAAPSARRPKFRDVRANNFSHTAHTVLYCSVLLRSAPEPGSELESRRARVLARKGSGVGGLLGMLGEFDSESLPSALAFAAPSMSTVSPPRRSLCVGSASCLVFRASLCRVVWGGCDRRGGRRWPAATLRACPEGPDLKEPPCNRHTI